MLEVKIENKSGILVIEPIGRLDGLSSKPVSRGYR